MEKPVNNAIGLQLAGPELMRLAAGNSLTSCEPVKRLPPGHVDKYLNSVGQVFAVADEKGRPQGKAALTECFITTYGKPDSRLLAGLGFGSDVERFQTGYSKFWTVNFSTDPLNAGTELFVTTWTPA